MALASTAEAIERADTQEVLSFALGSEEYAIDILKVQEIRRYESATSIPNTPAFLRGVINLRGSIIPIVDLRIHFGMDRAEINEATAAVILRVAKGVVGIVVDRVCDVITLAPSQIKPTPAFTSASDGQYVAGVATAEQRMLILLDIERLIAA